MREVEDDAVRVAELALEIDATAALQLAVEAAAVLLHPLGVLLQVVDDEPHVVTLKCAILESAGHTVTASTSARDAMEKLQSNTYDAVVTDWRLGDANGRAVVQAAKNNSSMPVVVVSGYVAEAFQAAEPLADLYLEKPVNPEELVTIVNELLKSSERATSH